MKVILFILIVVICQVQAGTRINKGKPVGANGRSTVAIFSYTSPSTLGEYCTGAFIHPEWILTSASCVKKTELLDMRVTTKDILKVDDAFFNSALLIKNAIAHPNFAANTFINDIGLIQIENTMEKEARILKLPQTVINVVNTPAVIRGYGLNGNSKDDLKQTEKDDIFVVDNKMCVSPEVVMTNKICTMEPVACKGDQGAPLIMKSNNILIGVTSLSDKHLEFCGINVILSFTPYTNVQPFKAWIKQVTNLNL